MLLLARGGRLAAVSDSGLRARGKPNGRAPAWKATTVQRVWAGVTARLAEPGAYLSELNLRMVKIDHMLRTNIALHWSKLIIVYIFATEDSVSF